MPLSFRSDAPRLARRYLLGGVLGLAATLSPRLARAQGDVASDESAPGISVHIGSVRAGTSVALERTDDDSDGQGRVVTQCFDDCEAVVDPGSYRLRLVSSDGQTIGTKGVRIRKPMTFHVLDTSPKAAHNRRLFRGEYVKDRKDLDARDAEPAFRVGIAPTPTGVSGGFALSF